MRFGFIFFVLVSFTLASLALADSSERELVLSRWEADRWLLEPGIALEPSDAGGRISLENPGAAFTSVNLPPTTTRLLATLRQPENERGGIEVLMNEAHGWTKRTGFGWDNGLARLENPLTTKQGWSWRVSFFQSTVQPPIHFRGFIFHGQEHKELQGKRIAFEIGPVRAAYRPDDAQWLYADLQPKTLLSQGGALPKQVVRVANLGTHPRTFSLTARLVERSQKPIESNPVPVGSITLAAGEMKELPIQLPAELLGRYVIEYAADGQDAKSTQREVISVVNALDKAAGFREWASRRKWFDAADRRAPDAAAAAKIVPPTANNGISPVPLFPVQAHNPLPASQPSAKPDAPFKIITSQLSPAWLIQSDQGRLNLFADSEANGLGAPTHLALATAQGTRIIPNGTTLSADDLRQMTAPWLLVWWQGAKGWTQCDVPHLVCLQHRPSALSLDGRGLTVSFGGSAGNVTVLPLFGCAKLPQQAAFQKDPSAYRLPGDWPADELHTWTWGTKLPAFVLGQCERWSRSLTRFPWNVRETYTVDHAAGAVKVADAFNYLELPNDWHTEPLTLAPLSPTIAVAKIGAFPLEVQGKLADLHYPTLFGPYMAIEGATEIGYSLQIGPYLMQAADPDLSRPADLSTAPRRAQDQLLRGAHEADPNMENQQWDFRDGNFVWNVQSMDYREPAILTAYVNGSSRHDRKSWLQARTLGMLLDDTRYSMNERGAMGLVRRYIDGPGIGNFGSDDWGDSGKLGTDMIYNAWCYAYATGDYQTIADRWDTITSLNVAPVTMTWLGVGRGAIAEMGDEAPPQLALARLAYAVGDRQTYAAASYWYARELVHHCVKDGAFTTWRAQFAPWHRLLERPTETPTNLWGTNAAWVGGGLRTSEPGENQWTNFYVRFDDADVLRFHRDYAVQLPRKVVALANDTEKQGNFCVFFDRVAVLGGDPDAARADFMKNAKDPNCTPDTWLTRTATSWNEFPPKMQTLIPADAPPVHDDGFAWRQMNETSVGMVNPSEFPAKSVAALRWFWDAPPTKTPGDGGDRWNFGRFGPEGSPLQARATTAISPVASESRFLPAAPDAPGK